MLAIVYKYFVLLVFGLILQCASLPDMFLRMGAFSFFLKPELPFCFTIKFSFGTADFDCCTQSWCADNILKCMNSVSRFIAITYGLKTHTLLLERCHATIVTMFLLVKVGRKLHGQLLPLILYFSTVDVWQLRMLLKYMTKFFR